MDDAKAREFARCVGLELKGRIVARGFTALQVATLLGRSPTAFTNWLNGKKPIPMVVFHQACEVIGADPVMIVDDACRRVAR